MKFLLLILSTSLIYSQQNYQVKYKMLTLFDGPKNYNSKLFISDTTSFFEYKLADSDTIEKEFQDINNHFMIYIPDKSSHKIFVNFNKKMISKIEKLEDNKELLVKDTLIFPVWEITNEVKKINEHVCFKSISKVKGREYIVWFTLDFPTAAGPWKLNGLPGLILEAHDVNNEVFFEAVEIKTANYQLPKEPNLLETISSKEFNFKFKKKMENIVKMLNASGDRDMKVRATLTISKGIELE